jgi:hypothetical protein
VGKSVQASPGRSASGTRGVDEQLLDDAALQELLHAVMAGDEAEPFVEALGVGASGIGRELDNCAVASARTGDCIAHQFGPETCAPQIGPDSDTLHLCSEATGVAETSNEGELVAANDLTIGFRNDDVVVDLVDEMREGLAVRLSGVGEDRISSSTEFVIVEQLDDGGQLSPASDPIRERRRHLTTLTEKHLHPRP